MYSLFRANARHLSYPSCFKSAFSFKHESFQRLRYLYGTKQLTTSRSFLHIKLDFCRIDTETHGSSKLNPSRATHTRYLRRSIGFLHGISTSASATDVDVQTVRSSDTVETAAVERETPFPNRESQCTDSSNSKSGTDHASQLHQTQYFSTTERERDQSEFAVSEKASNTRSCLSTQMKFSSGFQQAYAQGANTKNAVCANPGDFEQAEQCERFEPLQTNRFKTDLSYQDVQIREAAAEKRHITVSKSAFTNIRGNSGLRRILYEYMNHVQPASGAELDSDDHDNTPDCQPTTSFSTKDIQFLQQRGYDTSDVVSWSEILSAQSGTQSVRRYLLHTMSGFSGTRQEPPLFVLLQILRFEHINAESLQMLISYIETSVENGDKWDSSSAAILLIRLLRHARMTRASFHEQIAELAPRILPLEEEGNPHEDARRLAHFYNRFLSLLALPVAKHPFLSIDAQQRAQLKIARSMMESSLRIQLNREGYRALARLQLMHKKTPEEQQWSSVKAPSWPPWRRDELGIDAKIEYPGRQSRVAKVIRRLLEAGYGPESIEQEAQILSGWDIDKSPTVQIRRIPKKRPLSWIRDFFKEKSDAELIVDHHIWAARVAATRSVREAWMCFYSYMTATANQKRQLRVYHEMFYKLFARVQQTEQKITPSPGDGKEVFADPISPRDLVYVHKEPPSIDELYAQMLQDGIQPAGRLLAGLLDNAQTLKQGFTYIADSTLTEVKKDLLLHPEKYPSYFMRSVYPTLPNYFFASYIGLVTKRVNSDGVELFFPGSKSAEEGGLVPLAAAKSLYYGMRWMQICRPKYLPAYHAMLEGICTQAKSRRLQNDTISSRRYSYFELWQMVKELLDQLVKEEQSVDLICFRKVVLLVRNSMIRAPSQFSNEVRAFQDAIPRIKASFANAIRGRVQDDKLVLPKGPLELDQQPYWKDVESLILLLGFGRDYASIVTVLKWLRQEEENLNCMDGSGYKVQRLSCAARVALEASWTRKSVSRASTEQLQQAKVCVENWGWPEDVDVDEYMQLHQTWFAAMRTAAQHTSSDSGHLCT